MLVISHIVLAKTPVPSKVMNTFYTPPLRLAAPAPLHMLNSGGQECEEMASRGMKLATHAGTRAVNRGQVSQTAANAEKKKKAGKKLKQEHLLHLRCLRVSMMRVRSAYSTRPNVVIA